MFKHKTLSLHTERKTLNHMLSPQNTATTRSISMFQRSLISVQSADYFTNSTKCMAVEEKKSLLYPFDHCQNVLTVTITVFYMTELTCD